GMTQSSDGDLSANGDVKGLWVIKLDGSGNIQWQRTYSDTLGSANYIEPTNDGGYILTGGHTVKLNSTGNVAWISNTTGRIIHQSSDNGYILCNYGMPGH